MHSTVLSIIGSYIAEMNAGYASSKDDKTHDWSPWGFHMRPPNFFLVFSRGSAMFPGRVKPSTALTNPALVVGRVADSVTLRYVAADGACADVHAAERLDDDRRAATSRVRTARRPRPADTAAVRLPRPLQTDRSRCQHAPYPQTRRETDRNLGLADLAPRCFRNC